MRAAIGRRSRCAARRRVTSAWTRGLVGIAGTDPRDLKVVDEETLPWTGPGFGAVTAQYDKALGKWIAIQANETPRYFLKGRVANDRIEPTVEPQLLEWEGLRGFRTFEMHGPSPRH